MKTENKKYSELVCFLLMTFCLSIIFYILLAKAGISLDSFPLMLGLMFCPGISALVTRLVFYRKIEGVGWRWGKTRYQLISYFLPVGYGLVLYGIIWLTGLGGFNRDFLSSDNYGKVVLSVLGLHAASIISAFGEEFGWRGYLVPFLNKSFSFTKTSLISGAVWALWHYPLIIFTNYRSFAGSEGEGRIPLIFALTCFTVMILGMSFVYAWLRLKSGSIWTAVLLHASHNLIIQQFFMPLTIDRKATAWLAGEFGIILAALSLIMAFVCIRKQKSLPV